MRIALTRAAGLAALPVAMTLTAATAQGAQRLIAAGGSPGGDPAAAVAGLVSLATAVIAGWLTLVLLLSLAICAPGAVGARARTLRDRITPALVRRWAAIMLGASVTASVLPGTAVAAVRSTAGDTQAGEPGWRAASPTTSSSPTGPSPSRLPGPGWGSPGTRVTPPPSVDAAPAPGWTPRRPPARQTTDPGLLTGRHRATPLPEIVVRRGDTLWSIASAHLGPDASDAEIAAAWPRWHAANRELIGPDPHLLLPGTRLAPPTDRHGPGFTPATKGTP